MTRVRRMFKQRGQQHLAALEAYRAEQAHA
jgi:hypothetical protein